jgi:hypothetical protein
MNCGKYISVCCLERSSGRSSVDPQLGCLPVFRKYVAGERTPSRIIKEAVVDTRRKWKQGREIKEDEGVLDAKQGLAESCTPSFASKADGWYNSQQAAAGQMRSMALGGSRSGRIATEGGKEEHLPADMSLDRGLRMEQGIRREWMSGSRGMLRRRFCVRRGANLAG